MDSPNDYATTRLPHWRQRIHSLGISLEDNHGVLLLIPWIAHGRDHESVSIVLNHNSITRWFMDNHADHYPTIVKHVNGKRPLEASTDRRGKTIKIHPFRLPPISNVLLDAIEKRRTDKFLIEAEELAAILDGVLNELAGEFTAELKAYAKRYYQQLEGASNGCPTASLQSERS